MGSYVYLFDFKKALAPQTFSFEGLGRFATTFSPSSTTGRWCRDSGTVDGAPLQACRELPIGSPGTSTDAIIGGYFGIIDAVNQRYRFAAGAEWTVPLLDGKHPFVVSLPVTINIVSGGEKDYKGLVRITPSITRRRGDDDDSEMVFGVSLALLGQRSLISEDFEVP